MALMVGRYALLIAILVKFTFPILIFAHHAFNFPSQGFFYEPGFASFSQVYAHLLFNSLNHMLKARGALLTARVVSGDRLRLWTVF